jgi:hypothetical protein
VAVPPKAAGFTGGATLLTDDADHRGPFQIRSIHDTIEEIIIKFVPEPTGCATRCSSTVNWLEGVFSCSPVSIRQRYF